MTQFSDTMLESVLYWDTYSVVSFIMGAENVHFVTGFIDEIRVRLTDLKTETATWTRKEKEEVIEISQLLNA